MSLIEECLCSIAESLRVLTDVTKLSKRDREFLPLYGRDDHHHGYIEYGTGRTLAAKKNSNDAGYSVQLTVTDGAGPSFWTLSRPMSHEDAMAELEKIKTRLEKSGE